LEERMDDDEFQIYKDITNFALADIEAGWNKNWNESDRARKAEKHWKETAIYYRNITLKYKELLEELK